LDKKESYPSLNLAIIKDRIEKHPYVEKAYIKNEKSKVVIEIEEKEVDAVVYSRDKAYLITNKNKLLPLLQYTENINFPVIKNPDVDKDGGLDIKNEDLLTALKIIKAIQFANPAMFEDLSEIDLRYGKDIVAYFTSLNYPVVLGRHNEIKKILYFDSFWSMVKGNSANDMISYADLRYNKQLIVGLINSGTSNGNKEI
jgi:cell division protein FtsQ